MSKININYTTNVVVDNTVLSTAELLSIEENKKGSEEVILDLRKYKSNGTRDKLRDNKSGKDTQG